MISPTLRPPRLAALLLWLLVRGDAHEAIAGDLREEFARRAALDRRDARRWYTRAARASIRARLTRHRSPVPIPAAEASRPMQDLLLDLRFALRTHRRNPGVALAILVTLGLGLGSMTAIFSVIDATLLRPLPFHAPEGLVAIYEENVDRGWTHNRASPGNFLSWRERSTRIEDMTAHGWTTGWALNADERPEWVRGNQVFYNFFEVFRAPLVHGPGFEPADSWDDGRRVVVISHGLWQRAFGGDPDIVGRTIVLDDRPREIVGVAPPGFSYPEPGLDVWSPLRFQRDSVGQEWFRRAHYISVVGRLAPGATPATADAELRVIADALEAEYPRTNEGFDAGALSLRDWVVGDTGPSLRILAITAVAFLLIACTNIANLLLTSAGGRSREIALRAALGAGRVRILRQLLTESLVLSVAGGLAGVVLARATLGGILRLAGSALPRAHEVAVDLRVAAFAFGIALLTGVLCGLAPGLQLSLGRLRESLGECGRGATDDRRTGRARAGLVIAEIALALVLVAGAGLMLRSLWELRSFDPGFRTDHLLAAEIEIPSARHPDVDAVNAFFDELLGRLRAMPGIAGAAYADNLPLEGTFWTSDVQVEGEGRVESGDSPVLFNRRIVDDRYLDTMGIPVTTGRGFTPADTADAEPVALINQELAARMRDRGVDDPVGRHIRFSDDEEDPWLRVVGVIGTVSVEGLGARPWSEILLPASQQPLRRASVILRFAPGTPRPDELFREALWSVDDRIPVISSRTMGEIAAGTIVDARLLATLLAGFAALALTIASLGIYGLLSFAAARQARAIGIRMALGARRPDVVRMVVLRAVKLTVTGLSAGVAIYLSLARYLGSRLYEVSATDGATLTAVAVMLGLTALAASIIPARRAARTDPVESLRAD